MNTFQRPASIPRNNRADWVETTVFQVYATLNVYKRETDEDYHLVLQDPDDGSTMVVEIPRPACVSPSSPFVDYIANARAQFDAVFSVTTQFQTANVPVVVTGVGFWDFPHGQRGAALNLVELHPARPG